MYSWFAKLHLLSSFSFQGPGLFDINIQGEHFVSNLIIETMTTLLTVLTSINMIHVSFNVRTFSGKLAIEHRDHGHLYDEVWRDILLYVTAEVGCLGSQRRVASPQERW